MDNNHIKDHIDRYIKEHVAFDNVGKIRMSIDYKSERKHASPIEGITITIDIDFKESI